MDELRFQLAPLTDWLPVEVRGRLPVEAWWLVELVAALLLLFLLGLLVRGLFRGTLGAVFGRSRQKWDRGQVEDLSSYPAVNGSPSLSVYHVPAWVRLVVVAPAGTSGKLDTSDVAALLDRAVPGLGAAARRDQPRARAWPAQLSKQGFINAFHRCTPTGRREGEATGWVALAGRTQRGSETFYLGLVLWTSEPTTMGRMNLEPHQWLDVLRMGAARP